MAWFVTNRDRMTVMKGPYKYSETAAVARHLIEFYTDTNDNLWIERAKNINELWERLKRAADT